MKKTFLILLLLFIYNLGFSQIGWFNQESGLLNNLKDVYFVNVQTGWVVGDSGKIIKTTNGGLNWLSQNSGTNIHLNAVRFYNEQTGWAVGGWINMGYAYAIIVNTTNGGNNWNIQPNPGEYTNIIYDIYVFDASNVMIVSGGTSFQGFSLGGYTSKTTNGGLNWSTVLGNYYYGPDAFTSLSFINQNTGWIGVLNQSDVGPGILKVYKTTNTGSSWSIVDSNAIPSPVHPTNTLHKVQFLDDIHGYLYRKNLLKKTTNGGANWMIIDSVITTNGNNYFFVNKDTGWIVKSSSIIRTTNGGANWNSQYCPSVGLKKLYFLNTLTGWAVGNNGRIVKTVNGGYSPPPDTVSVKYFPLAVGNVWKYNFSSSLSASYYHKSRITRDTIINEKKYFIVNGGFSGVGSGMMRYDSLTGNIYYRSNGGYCSYSPFEVIIDSLASKKGDTIIRCSTTTKRFCSDTSSGVRWGIAVKGKIFKWDNFEGYETVTYSSSFGVVSYYMNDFFSFGLDELVGCYINGVLYGDTSDITYSISGTVKYFDNNQPATNGWVKAIKLDKNTANIIVVDSAQIQSDGSYTLTKVPQDSVDIGIYPNSTTQSDWVVTYHPSTIYWQNSATLYPTGNLTNVNVGAIRMTAFTNNNSVSGKVMRLTDNPLANLKDAVLYAKSGNTFVRCTTSDGNGVYHLNSLPTGNLKIIVNRLGFTSDSTSVNVTATSNIDSVNFYLNRIYVSVKKIEENIPTEYKLYQNYPNPFNPVTIIKYMIAENRKSKMENGLVSLKVYNILGKELATLVNEKQSPGVYEVMFDASYLPSGIYFYKLETENYKETKRMVLIK